MTIFSIIQKSQLEGADRIDAEYYQPEYLLVNKILENKSLQSKTLIDIISRPVVTGSTPKSRNLAGDGTDIKFVKTDVVRDGEINFDSADLLPTEASRTNSEPKGGDILITIIGASYEIIGRSACIFADDPKMNINQNIALVRPKEILLSGYLETFLRSKFGRDQLWQQSRQTEQVNLNCREVENILIPILDMKFQNDIDELVNHARALKLESAEIYKQAENLLLEELGLKDFKTPEDLSYIVNYSDVEDFDKLDSEFHQPKFGTIFKYIKTPVKTLEEISSFLNHSKQPPYFDDGNVPIVTQKHLGQITIDPNLFSDPETKFTDGKWLDENKNSSLKQGDLLYYSVGAYLGKTNVILEKLQNVTAASFLTIIRPKDKVDPIYLAVVLNSIVGQLQSEKWQSATAQQYIYPKDIKRFKIPILPKGTQQKIGDLVKKSHEARKKSKELLEEAKRKVEDMIEGGGGKKV